jgi:hypothetical protein
MPLEETHWNSSKVQLIAFLFRNLSHFPLVEAKKRWLKLNSKGPLQISRIFHWLKLKSMAHYRSVVFSIVEAKKHGRPLQISRIFHWLKLKHARPLQISRIVHWLKLKSMAQYTYLSYFPLDQVVYQHLRL